MARLVCQEHPSRQAGAHNDWSDEEGIAGLPNAMRVGFTLGFTASRGLIDVY